MKKRIVAVALSVILLASFFPTIQAAAYSSTYTIPALTGNQAQDVANIALSQVGYHEDGNGGTAYGAWWTGVTNWDVDYTNLGWCAMFACWCANQAGAGLNIAYDKTGAGPENLFNWLKNNAFYDDSFSSTPKAGDFIFFGPKNGTREHVAVITGYNASTNVISFVGGNQGTGEVKQSTCQWNSSYIWDKDKGYYVRGYGRPNYNASSGEYLSKCQSFASSCTIKITASSSSVWSLPCNSSTSKSSKVIETATRGTTYSAKKLYYNTEDHYWYQVTSKSGETAYIYAGNCEYVSLIDDLSIRNAQSPGTLSLGQSFPLSGTINVTNSMLSSVSAYVYSSTGVQKTGGSENVNCKSYSLNGSAIDKATAFGSLPSGRYTYVVSATAKSYYATSASSKTSATKQKTLFSASFNVQIPAQEDQLPIGQLTLLEGSSSGVVASGWAYDPDQPDFRLAVWVTIDGVKCMYSTTADTYFVDAPAGHQHQGFSRHTFFSDLYGEHEVKVYTESVDEFGNRVGNLVLGSGKITIEPPHTHSYTETAIPPTCTEEGYTIHSCSCGLSYTDSEIYALGHDYDYFVEAVPTLQKTGLIVSICIRCGDTKTFNLPCLNSDSYQTREIVAATCTEAGIVQYSWGAGDFGLITEAETDPLGHEFVNGICMRCGKSNVIKGDLNGDNIVSSADAVLLSKYLIGIVELTSEQIIAADLNDDGTVSSADAVLLSKLLIA
ncbi:MAG: dockerin type I domain-containing protein [Faecousia sp.]